ncbi:MAG: immunoglobulin domain-containing protein, partial [Oscillospiraceae bacterium]|nr:immunoglobulin domain-containing protein [Oscillospiraceae bacterium]
MSMISGKRSIRFLYLLLAAALLLSLAPAALAADGDDDAVVYTGAYSTLEITAQPEDFTGPLNSTATFTVAVNGSGLTYQWQYSDNGTTWKNSTMTGNKTDTMSVKITANADGRMYRCVIKDSDGNSVTSEYATLTIGTGPVITEQPRDASGEKSAKVIFSVTAEGDGLTYQWQHSTDNGDTWANSSYAGAKTAAETVTVSDTNTARVFRCVITDANGVAVTTNVVTLTMTEPAPADITITEQPENVSAKVGQSATFSVVASGEDLTYQWKYQTPTGTKWTKVGTSIPSAVTANLVMTAAEKYDGYKYRCVITDADGQSVTSDYATLTVQAAASALKITKHPADAFGEKGDKVTFSVTAEGDGLTYQWQHSTDNGSTWSNSGYTGNKTAEETVAVNADNAKRLFRCVVKDSSGDTVTSNVAKLTMQSGSAQTLVITTQPTDVTAAAGEEASISVVATGSGLTYVWKYLKPDSTSWYNVGTSITGSRDATMTFEAAAKYNGYKYKCVVTDANGNRIVSDEVTLTVSALNIIRQPKNVVGTRNSKVDLTVTAKGTNLSYQWQHSEDGGTTWKNSGYTGNKTAAMTITINATSAGRIFRCVITDASGSTATTNTVTVTIGAALAITAQPDDVSVKAKAAATFTIAATG